jgi:hypothetical protein
MAFLWNMASSTVRSGLAGAGTGVADVFTNVTTGVGIFVGAVVSEALVVQPPRESAMIQRTANISPDKKVSS